jgi:trehalose 6-phosphate synthase/phosphatase
MLRQADCCQKELVEILPGNKVVEVKVSGMDKGTGTKHWLEKKDWDFALAFGDDRTDEDMFTALPETAYSIRVGWEQTAARFNMASNTKVREILWQLVKNEK